MKHLFASLPPASGLLLAALALGGCAPRNERPPAADAPAASLKEAYEGVFLIGAALSADQFSGRDPRGAALVAQHFNSITAENDLKWERVHPEPDRYDFEAADRFVAFGEEHDMFVVGHTLVWHNQTPRWVFEDADGRPLTREALLERMRDHIHTVVGRYKGRIHGWDVVNEALDEDGTLRESPWLRIIGEDYLAQAFRFAHEADPEAELYYNDYSLENAAKRDGAVRLVKGLLDRGVRVTGIGSQGHNNPSWPTPQQQADAIRAFGALGVKVMITELDVDVLPPAYGNQAAEISRTAAGRASLDPYREGLPDSMQQALARQYAELFRVYAEHRDAVTRVTFWGVTDGDSWKNNWPVRGRTNYPLLFDREGRPKPAFHAVMAAARQAGR